MQLGRVRLVLAGAVVAAAVNGGCVGAATTAPGGPATAPGPATSGAPGASSSREPGGAEQVDGGTAAPAGAAPVDDDGWSDPCAEPPR